MDQDYIRIKEAAGLLGVTPLTLRNWDKKGLLIAYRHPVNNYRLYRTADVQGLLARVRQPEIRTPTPTAEVATYTNREIYSDESDLVEVVQESAPPPIQRLPIIFEDDV